MGNNKSRDKKVLIIGGAGYIGSVLTGHLLREGCKVKVLDDLIYGNSKSLKDHIVDPNFEFIKGDFGDDKVVAEAIKDVSYVVLLAALVGDPICKKYPELARNINLEYPKKLIRQLTGKGIDRFVFTSTCSNYGLREDDVLAKESDELKPLSLYAETKVAFEKFILDNLDDLDFDPVILRLATAFGISPRMRFDLTVSEFTRDLCLGKELLVYDENTWRPYCNVNDISRAIISMLDAHSEKVRGEVFNVGSDRNNYTKKMIVEEICKHIENPKIIYKSGDTDPRNYRVSFDKISSALDFKADVDVDTSIEILVGALNKGCYIDIETDKNYFGNYIIPEK